MYREINTSSNRDISLMPRRSKHSNIPLSKNTDRTLLEDANALYNILSTIQHLVGNTGAFVDKLRQIFILFNVNCKDTIILEIIQQPTYCCVIGRILKAINFTVRRLQSTLKKLFGHYCDSVPHRGIYVYSIVNDMCTLS